MNHRECWQPCWPYTPARETRGQPSIAPTMPTNTAQSDPAEPLKTADLPLHYAENGASTTTPRLLLLAERGSWGRQLLTPSRSGCDGRSTAKRSPARPAWRDRCPSSERSMPSARGDSSIPGNGRAHSASVDVCGYDELSSSRLVDSLRSRSGLRVRAAPGG